jgi:hypothetical protein
MKQVIREVEATIAPKAESSVEITTDSKGLPKLTVKVYHEDSVEALRQALALYALGTKELQAIITA